MPLPNSGVLPITAIKGEFGGDPPLKLSDYVRGGGRVPEAAANGNIPTSVGNGTSISLSSFYSAVNAIVEELADGTTIDAATVFGDTWSQDIPKQLLIPSGVTVGSTDPNTPALNIPSGMSGTLEITVEGDLLGAGGNAGGGVGGDALALASGNVTLVVNGAIKAGGGGGGAGGDGGQGGQGGGGEESTTTTESLGRGGVVGPRCASDADEVCRSYFDSDDAYCGGGTSCGQVDVGQFASICDNCKKTTTTTTEYSGGTGGSGGAGGTGGRGEGYSQSAANGTSGDSGSSGASGGTNAGKGGTGGTGGAGGDGGSFGQPGDSGVDGANGAKGANGNRTDGLSGESGTNGESGGEAGFAITNFDDLASYTNNGTVIGRT